MKSQRIRCLTNGMLCLGIFGLWANSLDADEVFYLSTNSEARFEQGDDGAQFQFVQRGWDRRQLKALEEYYDDLEDYYDDINPHLADYYERLENYYEDLRKGKRVAIPPGEFIVPPLPGGVVIQPPPFAAPQPFGESVQPRAAARPDPYRVLVSSYRDLLNQLRRLSTGENWQRYLQLPIDLNNPQASRAALQNEAQRNELLVILERYDRTAGDDRYRAVTRLPAFNRTRTALNEFIGSLFAEPDPVPAEGDPLPPEEIPLPGQAQNANPASSLRLPQLP